ncbi:MAG TPA: hypothetical protein VFO67_16310 [Gemmatimonadales bacterium]|nr:hypothetical protein [Gemmatimonadales bacterium]
MNSLRALPVVAVLSVLPTVACRDAASSPTRPDFGVSAADTVPGGCTARACTFKSFGNAAFVSWTTLLGVVASDTGGGGGGTTFQFGSADVSRGGDRGEQQTFVSYNVVECSQFCTTIASGFGLIPNSDFTTNGQSYSVSTNTTNNPNFFTFVGSPGVIEIEWTPNGLFSQQFNGTSRMVQPGFTQQQVGQSDNQSASAAGSVVGFAIGDGSFGQISSSRDMRIMLTR